MMLLLIETGTGGSVWITILAALGFASISPDVRPIRLGRCVCALEKNCLYCDLPELVILGASGL